MPTCIDCKNYRSRDDLDGYCSASEDKLVEYDRDVEDCLANSFEPKNSDE